MSTPIFILGNPRSGTTALATCFKEVLKIQGYIEGHFLKHIDRYKETTDSIFDKLTPHEKHKSIAMGNITKDIFTSNLLSAFKHTYESLFDNSQKYWFDKTPGIMPISDILYMWPNAKFIMLKRRSLENINSRIIKWKDSSFTQHCQQWSDIMKNWYYLDKSILGNNFIEIEHYDMLFNVHKVAQDIINLLPEYTDINKEIINFFSSNIVKGDKTQWTINQKPSILDIDTINWTDEQKETHNKICLETLHLYNYSCDKNYFL
jgi:hypothetical protein